MYDLISNYIFINILIGIRYKVDNLQNTEHRIYIY